MTEDKSLSGSADGDSDADRFRQSRVCHACGEALRPGERVVQAEHGEYTPYGMALIDAASDTHTQTHIHYYHEPCVPLDLGAAADADDDAGG